MVLFRQEIDLIESTLSVVSVRHPLSRVASVYYQKILDSGMTNWRKFNGVLKSMFRGGDGEDSRKEGEEGSYEFAGDNPYYAR